MVTPCRGSVYQVCEAKTHRRGAAGTEKTQEKLVHEDNPALLCQYSLPLSFGGAALSFWPRRIPEEFPAVGKAGYNVDRGAGSVGTTSLHAARGSLEAQSRPLRL